MWVIANTPFHQKDFCSLCVDVKYSGHIQVLEQHLRQTCFHFQDWDFGRRAMFWKLHRLWGQPKTIPQLQNLSVDRESA